MMMPVLETVCSNDDVMYRLGGCLPMTSVSGKLRTALHHLVSSDPEWQIIDYHAPHQFHA